jgi:hypothetical protein
MNNKVKFWVQVLGIGMLVCVVGPGYSMASDQIEINCHQTPDLDCSPSNLSDGVSNSQGDNSRLSLNVIQQANTDTQNVHSDIIADTTTKSSGLVGLSASIAPSSSLYKTKAKLQRSQELKRPSTTLPRPLLASIFALIGIVAVARRNVSGRGGMEEGASSNSPKRGGDEDHEVHLNSDSKHHSNHLPVNSQTYGGGVHS